MGDRRAPVYVVKPSV
jgi:hypothetical protein